MRWTVLVPDNSANSVSCLGRRIACNQAYARGFPEFVLEALDVRADDVALELGPGFGGQLIPVAERVRRVVGVEVSRELAATLRARALHPNALVIDGDMDALVGLDVGPPFSLAYAVYSLHYSRDPDGVARAVAGLLAGPRARFVVVTPDTDNNARWYADLGRLYDVPADALAVPHLGRRQFLPALRDSFSSVTCTTFRVRVRFPTVDVLMDYYDACAPYCPPAMRDAARRYFGAMIEQEGCYEIDKHSLALIASRTSL